MVSGCDIWDLQRPTIFSPVPIRALHRLNLAGVESTTPDSLGPSVDVALLADAVQAVRGKLFILGGGWDTLWVARFPARHPSLAIGLRLRIPVSWTGENIKLAVELQDADGRPLLPRPLTQEIKLPPMGQHPPNATDFGLIRSFTFNNLVFRSEGSYSFVITVDDEPVSRLRFTVRARPALPPPSR